MNGTGTSDCSIRRFGYTALLAMVIVLLCIQPCIADRVLLDRVVAVVNGEVITWSQLRGFIPPDAMAGARARGGEEAATEIGRLESRYLEDLVELRLQAQAADAEGISVEESEVNQAVDGIRNKFALSDEAFSRALKEQGLTLQSYKENLREQILVHRVVNRLVRPRVVINNADVDRVMAEEFPEFAHRNIAARVRLIRIDEGNSKKTLALARKLVEDFNDGASFADLAQEYSTDPSARFGGELGVIRRGMIKPGLESAAFALEAGRISEPLLLDEHIYLLLVDSFEEQSGDVAAARRQVTEKLQEKAMEKEYLAWLRQLKGKAYVEIKLN